MSPCAKSQWQPLGWFYQFGHTLTDQIQGQITAGFVIAGFYEDKGEALLDEYTDVFIATRAIKPSLNCLPRAAEPGPLAHTLARAAGGGSRDAG